MAKQKRKNQRKRKLDEVNEDTQPKRSPLELGDEHANGAMEGCSIILPTREIYVKQLEIVLRRKHFALVEGDIGSGKTFIVGFAARNMSLPLHVMQIGDQMDAKSLYGTYECTEVAGQFRWRASSFHKLLLQPGVIVLEDVDTATGDVISSLVELASRRKVTLPSGDELVMHEESRLVATILSTRSGRRNYILDGIPSRISLPSLTDEELKRLAKCLFPRSAHLANSICKLFREVQSSRLGSNSRRLTSTDFVRACSRVNRLDDLSCNDAVLLELLDVWCICEPCPYRRSLMANSMASLLSLSTDQIQFAITMRTPTLTVQESFVRIGRANLERNVQLGIGRWKRLGETREALQLMERMAICVSLGEPVLLVGESGVGKTSLVQSMADMVGCTLKVVNLGPHSDPDDLITSLRPTSFARLLEPFTKDFSALFSSSFDSTRNEKFLQNLQECLSKHRYNDYLSVVEETARKVLVKKGDSEWGDIVVRARRLRMGISKGGAPFMEQRGTVREAAEEGYWILIDEINLAAPECLDAIVDSISSRAHPQFRMFACMNPATDSGKRRLPEGIRSRFTEFSVEETTDEKELAKIVSAYLPSTTASTVDTIISTYVQAKKMVPMKISLRTLCRSLVMASDGLFESENRCLFEGLSMAFLSNLEQTDKSRVASLISSSFPCTRTLPMKCQQGQMIVEGYAIEKGDLTPADDDGYVITKTVKINLAEVARIVSSGRLPVLLEGETSAGKTSIITHLGRITGNVIKRINNHEHTDVQEYMGVYVPDSNGRLSFREGPLVEAVRNGYWVILDELNLAPTDVIETLNRLLDDNRELFVSETNEVIKAHRRFRLFSTQNPAGVYAGRKRLSRALLSRFVVLLFPHLPMDELSCMVCARCKIAPSAAQKMLKVLSALRLQRSLSGLFSSRDGLMTLRDVFRWGYRLASDEGDDWQAALLHHGFFLLAGRCRNESDKSAVICTLESVLKRKIIEEDLFSCSSRYFPHHLDTSHLILTLSMRRMLVLSWQGWMRNEAVLIVGETGEGKTRLAETLGGDRLLTINCHERTETSDLLGRLRPIHDGGFEWQDGVVIEAMREGKVLLMDEISLAEDSVLERLNPLFEEKRCIQLTDSGSATEEVFAKNEFNMIATMNPGGDYGKKELSKALRNRFTEIWCSTSFDRSELISLFLSKIPEEMKAKSYEAAEVVVEWMAAFHDKFIHLLRVVPSLRDLVAVAELFSVLHSSRVSLSLWDGVAESLSSVFIDSLPCLSNRSSIDIRIAQEEALKMMNSFFPSPSSSILTSFEVKMSSSCISIGPLSLPFGPLPSLIPPSFSLSAPTCVINMYRILRALYIKKPILLEGSPGCGKSTGVMALAALGGYPCTRLNLSEQTDLSDLFGNDVPIVDGEGNISFEWQDGPVLKAIKNGEWLLLDEMNLASQSVLEGLNACFDHRRVLYIAELAKEFAIPEGSQCRFFACQNPRSQGGNRRALPKSFVNRFTNIYATELTEEDQVIVLKEKYSNEDENILKAMVQVNSALEKEKLMGGPFSFNLRDLQRWLELKKSIGDGSLSFEIVYVARLRMNSERERARTLFSSLTQIPSHFRPSNISLDSNTLRVGPIELKRGDCVNVPSLSSLRLLPCQSSLLLSLSASIAHSWLTLLVGPRNSGKRSVVETLSWLMGHGLEVISLSADTDAQELIGSYEQKVDESRVSQLAQRIGKKLRKKVNDECIERIIQCTQLFHLEREVEIVLSCTHSFDEKTCNEVRELLVTANRSEMYFEWVDSVFVTAFTQGKWILMENANLCNAAVLDRLNSCLEDGGRLVVSERTGSFEAIKPHPNFRIILSMDSSEGEVSRAMRNRSVELFMREEWRWNEEKDDTQSVLSALSTRMNCNNITEQLDGLSSCKLLHCGVLMGEMEEEEVARLMGRGSSQEIRVDDNIHLSLQDLSVIEKRMQWEWNEWKKSECMGGKALPLLHLLSTSIQILQSPRWKDIYGEDGMRLLSRVSSLLPSNVSSSHPYDPTFHGRQQKNDCEILITQSLFEWAITHLNEMKNDARSALVLASSLTSFELSSCDEWFDGMEMVVKMDKELKNIFVKENKSLKVEAKETLNVCLDVLSLMFSLRQSISSRSRETRIRIAFSKLTSILMRVNIGVNPPWSLSPSQSLFLDEYSSSRLANAFSTQESCQLFRDQSQKAVISEKWVDDPSLLNFPLTLVGRCNVALSFLSDNTLHYNDIIFSSWPCALSLIGWRNENSLSECSLLSVLSHHLADGLSFSSLYNISPLSTVLSSLWEKLNWDPSLRCICIGDLADFSMSSLVSQLWRLAANSKRLTNTIRGSLMSLFCMDGDETIQCEKMLRRSMDLVEKTVPPLKTIDPLIYREELGKHIDMQLRVVESLMETLCEWRRRTGGRSETQVDIDSCHPLLSALCMTKMKLEEEKEKLCAKNEDVFREDARQFSCASHEMHSFVEMVRERIKTVEGMNWRNERGEGMDERLTLLASQMNSLSTSGRAIILSLCTRYSSMIDVTASFVIGTWMVVLSSGLLGEEIEREVTWRRLSATVALPPRMDPPQNEWMGIVRPSLVDWSTRIDSPLPLSLKSAIVEWTIGKGEGGRMHTEWTREQWRKWYEKHVNAAQQKEFEYRSKTMEEKEDNDLTEFFSATRSDTGILGDSCLLSLLQSFIAKEKNGPYSSGTDNLVSAISFLACVTTSVGVHEENEGVGVDAIINILTRGEKEKERSTLDVYRESSRGEVREAMQEMDRLVQAVRKLQEKWPEVQSLSLILEAVENFYNGTISDGQMKNATALEKILEESEQWEKISDRSHSLEDRLAPLRMILVRWKQMEIRFWSSLIERVERESHEKARLVSFPLFDGLFQSDPLTVVALAAEWISHSSLLDFSERIDTIRLLAAWARQLNLTGLGRNLESLAQFYSQWTDQIKDKLNKIKEPIQNSLKQFVRIAQYKDLNLLSIKASAHKNHIQLFKMVKKLKEECGVQVEEELDGLLNVDGLMMEDEGNDYEYTRNENEDTKVDKARRLVNKVMEKRKKLVTEEEWNEMASQSEEVREEVTERVVYKGDEEEMEKEQGRARNRRQRAVALLIKDAQEKGLNSRRAVTVNGEKLSAKGLTQLPVRNDNKRLALVRATIAARNSFIRRSNKPNEQLSISTRGHMSGMVEYGTNWTVDNEMRQEEWEKKGEKMNEFIEAFNIALENTKCEWFVSHSCLSSHFSSLSHICTQIDDLTRGLVIRMDNVPSHPPDGHTCGWSPLALLHSEAEHLPKVKELVDEIRSLAESLVSRVEKVRSSHRAGIFPMKEVQKGEEECTSILKTMKEKGNEIEKWFDEEGKTLTQLIHKASSSLANMPLVDSPPTVSIPLDCCLLFIQRVYKEMETECEKMKCIDRLTKSAEGIEGSGVDKMLSALEDTLHAVREGSGLSEESSIQAADIAAQLYERMIHVHARAAHSLTLFVYRLSVLGVWLMEKGYVNTIPKEDKNQEEGTGKEETGEGGGMGEGKGNKDVTQEMEETGQIEPLQGEDDEGGEGEEGTNERPIEMEEDFPEDIEDVDREGNDEGSNDENDDEEPQMDDQMGEVDDKDEEELDPHLWDDKEKEEEKNDIDQDNKGADRETGEKTAKEDEKSTVDNEKKEEEEEANDDDMENMDGRDREEEGEEEKNEEREDKGQDGIEGEMEEDEKENEQVNDDLQLDNEKEDELNEDGEEKGEEMEVEESNEQNEDNECEEPVMNEKEDKGMNEEDEKMEEEEELDGGCGGEEKEEDKKNSNGTQGEENEEEDEERKKEDQEQQGQRDKGGKGGQPDEKEKTKKEKDEEEDDESKTEKNEREKKIVEKKNEDTNEKNDEEEERIEGNDDEKGQEREEREEGDREMSGGATMEEAKRSTRERVKEREKRKEIEMGNEMEVVDDENEMEEKDALIHLAPLDLLSLTEQTARDLIVGREEKEDVDMKRIETNEDNSKGGEDEWKKMAPGVSLLAAELAENLRLILEPRLATRMQGDYRTGKRLNMKRIIPYIASEYRKNRIWMRRSKLSERNYQVLIAVDDSASMKENGIEQVTCQGVCIVEEALRRVNAGQLGVVSFGKEMKEIVSLKEGTTPDETGPLILSSLSFSQTSTDLCALLHSSAKILDEVKTWKSEQMLIVLSDGRGALSQGVQKVKDALTSLSHVAVLFVILDCGSKSISEVSVASFEGGKVSLVPYLSLFPFPLYVLARSLPQVPSLLAEALRQWIECGTIGA